MTLSGKTLIVTGASSGIGAAAARLLAAQGAKLVLGARRAERLEALVADITDSGVGQAVALAGDVTKGAYAEALVALAVESFGRLDGAFNNAGTVGEMGPVPAMSDETWHHVLETNLTSAFLAAKAQIPVMQAQGQGALVFTSSFVGHTIGMPGMGAYAASKAGMIGLVQSLAAEHGPEGIRVNALLPGGTKTAMAGEDPEFHAFVEQIHALKRMAAPEEIAQAAAFLLSDQASFVTGTAMLAEGGVSICKT